MGTGPTTFAAKNTPTMQNSLTSNDCGVDFISNRKKRAYDHPDAMESSEHFLRLFPQICTKYIGPVILLSFEKND